MKIVLPSGVVIFLLILLFVVQPGLAIYGLIRLMPTSPDTTFSEWVLLVLCILVLVFCILSIVKDFDNSIQTRYRRLGHVSNWIGFTVVSLFDVLNEHLSSLKKEKEIQKKQTAKYT